MDLTRRLCVLTMVFAVGCDESGAGDVEFHAEFTANDVDDAAIEDVVRTLAQPAFAGRAADTEGGRLARDWIVRSIEDNTWLVPRENSYIETFDKMDGDDRLVSGSNVVAQWPGAGTLASEMVVLMAHYDHLGVIDDALFPGAVDNAGGVGLLLDLSVSIPSLLADAPERRTIVWLFTDAEEIGLLGAEAFVEQVADLGSMVVVNVDTIGGQYLTHLDEGLAIGVDSSPRLASLTEEINAEMAGVYTSLPMPSYVLVNRSDITPFLVTKVPSIWLTTGISADVYHLPFDTPELFDLGRAVAATVWAGKLVLAMATEETAFAWREPEGDCLLDAQSYDTIVRRVESFPEDLPNSNAAAFLPIVRTALDNITSDPPTTDEEERACAEDLARLYRLAEPLLFP